jgi:hypothetical protein
VQMQAVFQMAQQAPQVFNMALLNRQMLNVLGIKDAEKLVPMPEDMKPKDPVTENQDILMMKPAKAFLTQDHQAHLAVHMSAMQDPKLMSMLQNNPQAQVMQQVMLAHINEHLGFEYRRQIEQQLGMAMPPQKDANDEDMAMDPEVEARLAPLLAQAAQRLLLKNQQEAAQKQAQQQAQDPLVQIQMQEVQIKAQDQERKAAKDQMDAQFKERQQQLEEARLRLSAAEKAMTSSKDRERMAAELSIDVLKHLSKQHQATEIAKMNRDSQSRKPTRGE